MILTKGLNGKQEQIRKTASLESLGDTVSVSVLTEAPGRKDFSDQTSKPTTQLTSLLALRYKGLCMAKPKDIQFAKNFPGCGNLLLRATMRPR